MEINDGKHRSYRNFHFIYAGYTDVWHRESPLEKGAGGCKLVLMKMGNRPEKTQPPESPFIKGDSVGIT